MMAFKPCVNIQGVKFVCQHDSSSPPENQPTFPDLLICYFGISIIFGNFYSLLDENFCSNSCLTMDENMMNYLVCKRLTFNFSIITIVILF